MRKTGNVRGRVKVCEETGFGGIEYIRRARDRAQQRRACQAMQGQQFLTPGTNKKRKEKKKRIHREKKTLNHYYFTI